jgi:hypothetical protein
MSKLYSFRTPYILGDLIIAESRQDVHLPIFKGGRSGLGSICASACPRFSPVCQQRGQKKALHGFQCGLLWLPLEDCGTFPTVLSQRSAGTTNSHLSQCWTNRLLAKSAWLFQGQIILLSSCCYVKRHVESPIFGLKSAVSRRQSAAAPLWGCKIPILCNEVLHPLLMTLQ